MDLKVVTINILGDLSKWKLRRALLANQLAELSPDIIMLQEVSLPENPAIWLSEQLNNNLKSKIYKSYVCPKSGLWGKSEGIGILSQVEVESYECIALGGQGRVAQKVHVRSNNQLVALINSHLFWETGRSKERLEQVRKLIGWIEEESSEALVVICGDFNDTPDSPTIHLMKERFYSAYECVHLEEPAYTYPTPLPVSTLFILKTIISFLPYIHINSLRMKRCSVLDYIFINHRVKVLNCQLVLDKPHSKNANIYPSDHLGLYAEITSIQ